MKTLPAKLSDCIRAALRDLETAEKSVSYHVNMGGVWHRPAHSVIADGEMSGAGVDPGACVVCLAGAVMAGSLGVAADQEIYDADDLVDHGMATQRTANKLHALDEFRLGAITLAYETFHAPADTVPLAVDHANHDLQGFWVSYGDDPAGFKEWAGAVADRLAAAGL